MVFVVQAVDQTRGYEGRGRNLGLGLTNFIRQILIGNLSWARANQKTCIQGALSRTSIDSNVCNQ